MTFPDGPTVTQYANGSIDPQLTHPQDDEDDEDFFSLPDLSVFPSVTFSWQTSPPSPQCAKRDTYSPFYTSFMDLGENASNRL